MLDQVKRPRRLKLVSAISVPVHIWMAGNAKFNLYTFVEAKTAPLAAILDMATRLVSIAVPSPMAKTAVAPGSLRSICQAITNRKIAPVQGRMAILSTKAVASRSDLTCAASSIVGATVFVIILKPW